MFTKENVNKGKNMDSNQTWLKTILPVALLGILALIGYSLLAGHTSVQEKSDGSKYIEDAANGDSVKIEADGSKTIKRADGTYVQIKPNGSKIIRDADGTLIEIKPDGSKIIKKNDGTSIQVNPK